MRWLSVIFLLALFGSIIYSNSFSVPFQFDDIPNIVENDRIKEIDHSLDFSGSRAIGYLTFAFNYRFGGLRVSGYHLFNLIIHIINGYLVYAFIILLFRAVNHPISRGIHELPLEPQQQWIALATAVLFIVHPIQTQAVTYIVQRFASLVALFYLVAVCSYLKYRMAPPVGENRWLWYGGALIATILAMKTKENSFTIPFSILLLEMVFFRPIGKRYWMALIPFLPTLLLIPLSHQDVLGEGEAGFAQASNKISQPDYLLTQFRVIVTYIRLFFIPVRQNLDYDYPISHSLLQPSVLLSFLLLLLLFSLGLYLVIDSSRLLDKKQGEHKVRPTTRLIGFGILWFFLTLSIESSIFPIDDVIFEHRLYLPSTGFFLSVTAGFAHLLQSLHPGAGMMRLASGLFSAVVIFLAIATYQRNTVWKNAFTLGSDVVSKAPNNVRAHYNLGSAYSYQGSLKEAIEEYQKALSLEGNYPRANFHLANSYQKLGRREEAIRAYRSELEIQPKFAMAHNNLANVLADQKRFQESLNEYEAAIRFRPRYDKAHANMATVLIELGRVEEAMEQYRIAIRLNPNSWSAHYNLGLAYQKQERSAEAITEYEAVIRLMPNHASAHNNLGSLYSNQGNLAKARTYFESAVRLNPNHAEGYYNLGATQQRLGEVSRARESFRKALQINPGLAIAREAIQSLTGEN